MNLFLWPFLSFVTLAVVAAAADEESQTKDTGEGTTTPPLCSPFGRYPNPLGITENERQNFHDIVKFPRQCWRNGRFVCPHSDLTKPIPGLRQLASIAEFEAARRKSKRQQYRIKSKLRRWFQSLPFIATLTFTNNKSAVKIGRYDEDRVGLYESELFKQNNSCPRTVHTGIDLAGAIGTPVHAFADGTIFTLGYNPALGDYGNVIVVQHWITIRNNDSSNSTAVVYALYGHLDDASIRHGNNKQAGSAVKKGQVLGWIGDMHECGGWFHPHVHFQLALHPPETHDMPGAVCRENREEALTEYFDPRYVVGELH